VLIAITIKADVLALMQRKNVQNVCAVGVQIHLAKESKLAHIILELDKIPKSIPRGNLGLPTWLQKEKVLAKGNGRNQNHCYYILFWKKTLMSVYF